MHPQSREATNSSPWRAIASTYRSCCSRATRYRSFAPTLTITNTIICTNTTTISTRQIAAPKKPVDTQAHWQAVLTEDYTASLVA